MTEGLEIVRTVESPEWEGACELLLGEVEYEAGALPSAQEHFARSLAICRDGADKRGEANATWRLGTVDVASGDYASARARLSEALQAFRNAEMWKELLGCLEEFAGLAQHAGRLGEAVGIAAASTVARQRLALVRHPNAEARWQRRLDVLRDAQGEQGFVAAWNLAWDQWETDDAIRVALALPEVPESASAQ
ncbi:MAG: tetratricopeptide repeat protein [Rubrivivax sp.]|nr:tetratricopeptide repeat protein [Rubrivivax sp.]